MIGHTVALSSLDGYAQPVSQEQNIYFPEITSKICYSKVKKYVNLSASVSYKRLDYYFLFISGEAMFEPHGFRERELIFFVKDANSVFE